MNRSDLRKFWSKEKRAPKNLRTSILDAAFWRRFIRSRFRNCHEVLAHLRSLRPQIASWENENATNIDLAKWLRVVAAVGNGHVHSGGRVNLRSLHNAELEMLERFFPGAVEGSSYVLALNAERSTSCLERFADYGLLIFKGLSVDGHYDRFIRRFTPTSG